MKACVLHHHDLIENKPLQLEDVPVPQPGSQEVLVKVSVCGICRTDLHVIEGELPTRPLPIIPGHQVVGRIKHCGESVTDFKQNDRVGIAWLSSTCGVCRFCIKNQENLCEKAEFTGWSRAGGFAEYIKAPAAFVYHLPDEFDDQQAAPLLCAGIIGFRSIRLTRIQNWQGVRIGLYGFGAAAHVAIQILKGWGAEVYVISREQKHLDLALSLGATWIGMGNDKPPQKLDAVIIFAPAGELVVKALQETDKGGRVICAGIHMSDIPSFQYHDLYHERLIRSVTNNTRQDGIDFLKEASKQKISTKVTPFDLTQANEALIALKHDGFQGAGILTIKPKIS
jgi:propanol-preferring alcohol dehydrogenase